MSNKEQAIALLDTIPEYKLGYIVGFLKGVQMDDEIEDMLFCQRMVDEYENDESPDKDETITLEELKEELGL
ncbi:MAG: hypothetical protein IJH37_03180 [Clostridia bacterium]|nr:hypothetical protein [Clostridia bacterium]